MGEINSGSYIYPRVMKKRVIKENRKKKRKSEIEKKEKDYRWYDEVQEIKKATKERAMVGIDEASLILHAYKGA